MPLKYLIYFSATTPIELWKPNGMSDKNIENITKSNSSVAPTFVDHHVLLDLNFNGNCLITSNISISKKVINLYISYTLVAQLRNLNTGFTLRNCLFGSVKLTKNGDLDKYKYSCYGIGFDSRSECSLPNDTMSKNVTIFGADMSLSVHIDNKGINLNSWLRTNTRIRLYYINTRSKISY